MKRIEIPIIENKNSNDNIDTIIEVAKSMLDINKENAPLLDSYVASIFTDKRGECQVQHVDLNTFYCQIANSYNLTKEQLIYIYNIYNTRWLNDLAYKYDFVNNKWRDNISTIDESETGHWYWDASNDRNSVFSIISHLADIRKEIATIFNCDVDKVAINQTQLDENPDYYVCLLSNLNTGNNEYVHYPELRYVHKNIYANKLKDASGLSKLKFIGRNGYFPELEDGLGIGGMEAVGGDLDLSMLTDPSLMLLKSVKGSLYLRSLKSIDGIKSLAYVGDSACFGNIEDMSYSNLRFIGGYGYFNSIKNINDLKDLKYVGKYLIGDNLTGLSKINPRIKVKSK